MERSTKTPKFWLILQPAIIRIYKVAGLVALTAILFGLLSFLTVSIFYFFDHTWVKPVVLSSNNPKVVEATTQLADARLRMNQLDTERLEINAQLDDLERTIKTDEAFLAEVGTTADAPKAPDQWMMHREVERTKLERENSVGRRAPLKERLKNLAQRREEQDALVKRLSSSPYLRASAGHMVLAFVPYANLGNVKQGTKFYSCAWGLVNCSVVGKVTQIIDGEVVDTHPHDESPQRGVMVEVEMSTPSAEGDRVLFAGSKPLVLF